MRRSLFFSLCKDLRMKPEVIIDQVFTNEPRCQSHDINILLLPSNHFKYLFSLILSLKGGRAAKCSFTLNVLVDLRQELAVRERNTDVSRMSALSSPTEDTEKMDTAAQASLSLPATPVDKGLDNAFANPAGRSSPLPLNASHHEDGDAPLFICHALKDGEHFHLFV